MRFLYGVLLVSAACTAIAQAGNILFLPPHVSPSHKLPMLPWADELARRGHNVLIWAPIAGNKLDHYKPKVAKIEQFTVPHEDERLNKMIKGDDDFFTFMIWTSEWNFNGGITEALGMGYRGALPFCERLLEFHREKFDSLFETKWDLIILDELFNPCGYLLVNMLKPTARATICTTKQTSVASYFGAVETPLSFVPNWGISYGFTDLMSLPQRIFNTVNYYAGIVADEVAMAMMTRRLQRFFPDIEPLRNARLSPDFLFVFYPRPLDFPRPLPPNVVHVGGLSGHAQQKAAAGSAQHHEDPLPPDIQKLIARPKSKGFVLFAIGHFANWTVAPEAVAQNFLKAFAQFPHYSFIWQFIGEHPKETPDNVGLFQWIPQKQLLRHKNVKLFISHCGGNSMNEAISEGVPMLAIPLFADQFDGATRVDARAAGIRMHKYEFHEEQLITQYLRELLHNQSYAANMAKLSRAVKDEAMSGLENAVYYSEFAVRHRGASFLKPSGRTSYFHWLVVLTTTVVSLVLALSGLKLICSVFSFGERRKRDKQKRQ